MTKFLIGFLVAAIIALTTLVIFYSDEIEVFWEGITSVVEAAPTPSLDVEDSEERWGKFMDDLDENINSNMEDALN